MQFQNLGGSSLNVSRLHFIEQAGETLPLGNSLGARDGLGNNAVRLNLKTSSFDFLKLIFSILFKGRNTCVGKGARHGA